MTIRRAVAGAIVSALVFTACGGSDGGSTLSQREFEDQLADICSRAQKKLDKIDPPADAGDVEQFAQDVAAVYTDTKERLADINPPEDAANDFSDFQDVIDDQIKAIGDLEDAGKDEDEAKINKALERITKRNEDQAQIADDLGVDECAPTADEEPVDTTPPATDAVTTTAAPAETTTTAPPLTLPPTLPPTLPSQTTLPVVTAPPVATGALFNVTSLVDIFNAPAGFSIVDSDPQSTQAFVDVVAAVPALNEGIAEMGVGVLIDNADGTAIATLVVGIAISDSMPAEWKDLLCGTSGVLQTSDQGFTGIQCPGTPGTGVSDIFTLTEGDIGVSIASVIQGIPAAAVADAFFTANF
jgi:hypothetical protein